MPQRDSCDLSLWTIRVNGLAAGYAGWKKLTQQAKNELRCPGAKPEMECQCRIHQELRSMLLRLQEQAATLEDFLIGRKAISRSTILMGTDFQNAQALIIIQLGQGYSFARFSDGWFQMLQSFFNQQ